MNLIAFTGRAGAGKDTAATALARIGYKQVAFADKLKRVVAEMAGEPVENFYDRRLKEEYCPALGMTRRRALQEIGNEMRRVIHQGVWVNAVMHQWHSDGRQPTVITDVRYDSEAQAVIDNGGVVILIERPGPPSLSGDAAAHVSERGVSLDLIETAIVNDGSVEQLEQLVVACLHTLGDRHAR